MDSDDRTRLEVLCQVAGIAFPADGADLLGELLRNQQLAAAALLEFDTQEEEPITTFDARWEK